MTAMLLAGAKLEHRHILLRPLIRRKQAAAVRHTKISTLLSYLGRRGTGKYQRVYVTLHNFQTINQAGIIDKKVFFGFFSARVSGEWEILFWNQA